MKEIAVLEHSLEALMIWEWEAAARKWIMERLLMDPHKNKVIEIWKNKNEGIIWIEALDY
jgi:hypothetical protein